MTSLTDAGSSPLQSLTYAYDAAGNVTSIADGVTPANSQSFNYDPLERLTTATGGYGGFGYTYDEVGNRLTQSLGRLATTYTYAAHSNQLASVSVNGANQKSAIPRPAISTTSIRLRAAQRAWPTIKPDISPR